jgi:hypothetical protein
MTPRWPNIDDIDIVELLTTTELVPDADMPRPTDGPHVVERIRLPLDTWQLVEAEAQARGIEPRELMAQLITAALSPKLQQVITQLARRTPPAA